MGAQWPSTVIERVEREKEGGGSQFYRFELFGSRQQIGREKRERERENKRASGEFEFEWGGGGMARKAHFFGGNCSKLAGCSFFLAEVGIGRKVMSHA